MSVDVFGRNLKKNEGSRGPPGFGFKITTDGQYNLDNKRLCNLANPRQANDAVNLNILQAEIQKVLDITSRLDKDFNNLDSLLEAHRDEIDKQVLALQADMKDIKETVKEISKGAQKSGSTTNQLFRISI